MTDPRNIKRSLGVLALYALLGPALGGLIVFAVVMGLTFASPNPGSFSPESLGGIATTLVMFGYAFGGLPALLTGLWLARKTFREATFTSFTAQLTAAVSTAVCLAGVSAGALVAGRTSDFFQGMPMLALILLPVALLSAHVCYWLAVRLRLIVRPAVASGLHP